MCASLVDEDSIEAVLGLVLLLLILSALTWFAYARWRLRYGSARWTMTEATIQSEYACNPARNVWKAVLQYSYQVAGEFYSGYFRNGLPWF